MIEVLDKIDEHMLYALLPTFLSGTYFESGLDLGCGDGSITKHLKCYCGRLLAVDKNKDSIGLAKRMDYYDEIVFKQMDLDEAFPNGQFGLVFMGSIFSYVKDLKGLMECVYDCLEEGGYILGYENATQIKILDNDKRFERIISCELNREGNVWNLGLWRKK